MALFPIPSWLRYDPRCCDKENFTYEVKIAEDRISKPEWLVQKRCRWCRRVKKNIYPQIFYRPRPGPPK